MRKSSFVTRFVLSPAHPSIVSCSSLRSLPVACRFLVALSLFSSGSIGEANSAAGSVEERAVQLERILDMSSFSLRTCAAQRVEGGGERILILGEELRQCVPYVTLLLPYSPPPFLTNAILSLVAVVAVSGSFEALGVHKGFSQTFLIEGEKVGQDAEWRISNDMLVIL